MGSRRRFVSLLATLAVAWTALWPLVSSVEAKIAGEEMPLCHQAGMQVAPDAMPQRQDGVPEKGKTHCPLCIMAFYASFEAPIVEPQFHVIGRAVTTDTYSAPLTHRVAAHLPESRAPPVCLKG
jgi:hypothetical protein